MSVTIIVDKGSPVLDDPTTQILHRYANGEVLVEAKDGSSGQPVSTGVVLDGKTVEDERDTLDKVGPNERIAAYVELAGPAESEMLDQLRKVGVTPQQFVPQSTYLSTGTGNALRAGRALAFVQGVVPLNKGLKEGFAAAEDDRQMMATVVASAALIDGPALEALVKATPDAVVDGDPEPVGSFLLLPVRLTAPAQTALLADSRILRVESREPKVIEDEVADLILVGSITDDGKPSGSYTKWLDDHAVNGSGVTIGIVDQGVDTSHPAFTGRISDLASGAKDWHGTFVAGHAAGAYMEHKDKDGFIYGVGMAPQAEILVQNNQNDATTLCNETVTSQGPSGNAGSIQNNSWGAGNKDPMDYQAMEASYDGLVRNALSASGTDSPLTICFSVGNDGTKGITRPHGAKNLIVTGNSENYRPDIGGADSDNVREIYSGAHASSHGNCGDGRIRPLVAAPGEWTASANYDSHPGEQEYVDDMITWGGGSSGASPKTAGACALLTEWWRSHDGNASPSPAMLRALVINGATPIDSGGEIPNMIQGWGRLNLDNIVRDDVHRSYVDQSILLTSRGDLRTWTIRPSDQTKPLWITLTWTDPPGAPGTGTSSSPAVVNKLAVRAKTKETQYRANQFSGGWSEPDKGDANEGWDNNQCIYLSADALGDTVEVSVTALELGMNCLTNQADTPQQDFALVIRGGYVDQGACPADVFLIIDGGAASPASSDGDHWASGSSDAGEVSDPAPAGDASDTGDAGTTDGGSGDAGAADGGTPDSGSADSGSTGSGDGGDAWWGEGDQPATETTKKNVVPPVVHAGASAGVSIADADPSTNVHGDATKPVADLGQALAAVDATWADHDATRRRAAVLVVGDATHVSNADVAVMRRLSFRGELWVLSTTQSILAFLAQRVHRRTGVHYRLCQDANDLAGGIRDALVEAAGFQRLTVRRAAADPTSPTATFEVVPDDDLVAVRVQLSDPQNAQIRVEGVKGAGTYVQPGAAGYVERSGADWRELRFQMDSFSPGAWTVHVNLKKARPVGVEVYARTRLGMSVHHDHTPDGPLVAAHGGERGRVGRMQFNPPAVAGDVVATPTTEAQRPIQVVSETSRIDSGGKVAEAPREMPAPTLGIVIPAPPTVEGARVVDLVGSVHGVVDSGHRFGRVVRRSIIDLEPRSLWRARLRPDLLVRTYAHVDDVVDHPDRVTALTLRRNGHSRKVWVRAPYLQRALRSLDLHDPDLLFEVRGPALVGVVRPVGHEKLLAAAGRVPASAGSGSLFSLADLEPAGPAVEDTKSNTDYASVVQFVPAKWFQAMPSGRAIKRVVIHITDGGALAKNTAAYFADPKDKNGNPVKASAHYVVGQAGEIYQCVREKDIAWHAGPSGNSDTIGIEHNARSAKELNKTDPGLPLTQVQYAASVALVKDICTRYKIPLDRAHIIGHNEADPKNPHPDCPTGQWDWTYFMNQLLTPAPATGGAAGAMSNGGAGASDASGGAGTGQPAGSPTGGGTPSGGTPDASGTDGTTDTSGDSTDASGSMDTSDSTDTTDTADSTDTSDSTDTADSTDTSGSDTTDTSGTGDDATDASSGGGDDTTDASGSDGIDDTGDVTDTSGSSDTGDTSDTSDTGDTTDISGSDGSGDMGGSSDTGTDDSGSADPGTTDGGDESFDSGSGDEPVVEIQRVLLRAGPPDPVDRRSVLVIARPIVKPIAVADGDGINRRILRPVWVGGLVPYLPTTPTPQLASPVAIGDFLIWPNAAERQGLYTLAAPHLRNVTLLVDRANVDVDGGTTTKITGGTAIITVSSYSDVTADELAALQADWAKALIAQSFAGADGWRYQPLQLKALDGALTLPPSDLDGSVVVASSPDAGTVTFSVPLTDTGALEWNDRFNEGRASLLPGVCTLTASYVAQNANLVDVNNHTLATTLGTLLENATSSQISVVNPQITVATRVIITAHDLVDAVTVDLVPSEGASATSFTFTKEGGQTTLPVTSEHIDTVTVAYTATVRYTPAQWPVIRQKGVLDFAKADWDVWVKPDSWLLEYDVVTMLLDDQKRVLAPGAETASDVITVRLDYEHPALSAPLSLTFQTGSQQLVKVPFPNPPGSSDTPSLTLTVMGVRGGAPAGPITRALTADENMIVVKAFASGVVKVKTNKDVVTEASLEGNALGVIAETRRAEDDQSTGTPTVLALSPSSGPEVGGTQVTVSGSGFIDVSSVDFDGTASPSFDTTDDSTITAESPPGTGTVDVTVTTSAGTSDTVDTDQFAYEAAPAPAGDVPAVTSVDPGHGPEAGGTSVAISGSSFTDVSSVQFGGTDAASYAADDDHTIHAESPAGTGTIDVVVSTAAGTSQTGGGDQFTYDPPDEPVSTGPTVTTIDPVTGPLDGGTTVTITGSGYTEVSSVDFGGTAATTFNVVDDGTITAEAPAGSGTVAVSVITSEGTSAGSSTAEFTYALDGRGDGGAATTGPPFTNTAGIDAFFQSKTGKSFIDWFNATQANKGPWAGRSMKTDADTAAGFNAVWDRLALMFGVQAISLDQFLALQSIFINELGGGMQPISELFGSPGHSGIAYLFDAIPGVKASYNGGGLSRTALDLFNDSSFLTAHQALPLGAGLAHATDAVWAGSIYPQNRYPTNASAAGLIFEADFAKFRGRGLIQTTWRSGYKRIIEWVQAYTGSDPTVSSYKTKWQDASSDTVASQTTNADWDSLFQSSSFEIPCVAVSLHNTSSGNYLNLSTDETVLLASGAGSLVRMGQRISGSSAYGARFKDRVVQMRTALS